MRITIAIIFGGRSPEYEVSLDSASAVIQHLDERIYHPVLVGITPQGQWLRYYGPVEKIRQDTWHNPTDCTPAWISPDPSCHGVCQWTGQQIETTTLDCAFPVLHGQNGEDGTIQGLLELAGIPVVGCGSLASAICMDKDVAHRLAQQAGVAVPQGVVARRHQPLAEILTAATSLSGPLFVKPARAGSSFGVTQVNQKDQLPQAIRLAFQYDDKILIEQAIAGWEVGCAVLGRPEALQVGEIDQIDLVQGFFDYHEKYHLETAAIRMPAPLSPALAGQVKETAQTLYQALECRGCARVDLFLTPKGELVFNEINTIPGFTSHSRYPNMFHGAGMDFTEMLDTLIALVVKA